jgi:hypothetical protein
MVVCPVGGTGRRVVNNEPQVNIRNIIVINMRIIVEIGENSARYLIRKYQTNPSINDSRRTKCEEIFTGDASMNAEVSKLFRFICGPDGIPLGRGVVDS